MFDHAINPKDTPLSFWERLTIVDRQIVSALGTTPGLTCKQLGEIVNIGDNTYGKFAAPARRLPSLRAWGIVSDVTDRCRCCNSALSRGQRNVPLSLTEVGRDMLATVRAHAA